MSSQELIIKIFLQMVVILVSISVVGTLAKKVGQSQVVAEMITGIILGPSIFGLILPNVHSIVFPKETLPVLFSVGQIGLVIYMFLMGLELNTKLIRKHARSAISVSLAGISAPFLLSCLLATMIFKDTRLFSENIKLWEVALLTGAAMSITAFPMLARIIFERGLSGSPLGTLALAAGSIDDALAWCILAVVLASFNKKPIIAFYAIGGTILYAIVILFIVRPFLSRFENKLIGKGREISSLSFRLIVAMLLFGAFFTDLVGTYSIFGAFILGVAMPRGFLSEKLRQLLEPMTTNILLPLFFVYSGLNTHFDLILKKDLLIITLIVIIVAIVGKAVACCIAALLNGEKFHNAAAVGVLMNARGLLELILLNILLENGVIKPAFFAIMVIMAIVTTVLVSPLFNVICRKYPILFKFSTVNREIIPGKLLENRYNEKKEA